MIEGDIKDKVFWRQRIENRYPKIQILTQNYKKEISNKMLDPEDETHIRRNKDQESKKLKKEKKKDKEDEYIILEKAKKDVLECHEIANKLKSENNDILKLNAQYVIQSTNKILEKEKESFNKNNYKYINDIIRNKLMKEMMNFKPSKHLRKLNNLCEINPEIKKDVENMRKNIDNDINELLDKKYYEKKLIILIKKNEEEINTTPSISNVTQTQRKSKKDHIKKASPDNNRKSNKYLTDPKEIFRRCALQLINFINNEHILLENYINDAKDKLIGKKPIKPKDTNINIASFDFNNPEVKKFLNSEDLDNQTELIQRYFPQLYLVHNSLIEVLKRKYNREPGFELENSKKASEIIHRELKEHIEKAKNLVLSIIPKPEEVNKNLLIQSLPSINQKKLIDGNY